VARLSSRPKPAGSSEARALTTAEHRPFWIWPAVHGSRKSAVACWQSIKAPSQRWPIQRYGRHLCL